MDWLDIPVRDLDLNQLRMLQVRSFYLLLSLQW